MDHHPFGLGSLLRRVETAPPMLSIRVVLSSFSFSFAAFKRRTKSSLSDGDIAAHSCHVLPP
jgi:hypothetical protein